MSERRLRRLVIGGAIAAAVVVAVVYFTFDFIVPVEKTEPKPPPSVGMSEAEVTNAFTAEPMAGPPAEVKDLLNQFARLIRRHRPTEACDLFDLDSLYSRAKLNDLRPGLPLPKYVGQQSPKFFPALLETVQKSGLGLPWDRIEIAQILPVAGDAEMVVFARHIAFDQVAPVRWHLVRQRNGLKIGDIEDLRTNYRVSLFFAIHLGTSLTEQERLVWQSSATALRDAAGALARDNPRQAKLFLPNTTGIEWPKACQNCTNLVSGLIAARLGEEFDETKLNDHPTALAILMKLAAGDNWLANRVAAAEAFEKRRGPTPETIAVRVQKLVLDNQLETARELVSDGLMRFPESLSLQAWAMVLEETVSR